jgi:hypothetical protein
MQGVLALIQSRNIRQEPYTITYSRKKRAKSRSNGVAEQEKGVNVCGAVPGWNRSSEARGGEMETGII